MSPYFGTGWRPGEDYLTVDLWVPHPHAAPSPMPVMVFVHGGGFTAGSTTAPLYDGSAFSRDGILLVTINYRLGIPGFLTVPDSPDNRGMLDVLAALSWVQTNVAAFGGDPANVTVFGQSAGAILIGGLLAQHSGSGLFRRAIVQSGSGSATQSLEQAQRITHGVEQQLGISVSTHTLGSVSDDDLVAIGATLGAIDLSTSTRRHPLGGITPFSLVTDEEHTIAVENKDSPAHAIDLLIGSNTDEGALYLAPTGLLDGTGPSDLEDEAARFFDDPALALGEVRAAHPEASLARHRVALVSEGLFRRGTRELTAAHTSTRRNTFGYEFAWRSNALEGWLGASHVLELPFVFEQLDLANLKGPNSLLGTTEPPRDLTVQMHTAWVRFAAGGNPGWAPVNDDQIHVFNSSDSEHQRSPYNDVRR